MSFLFVLTLFGLTFSQKAYYGKVTNSLPGYDGSKYTSYSGYITLSKNSNTSALYFWFYECSEKDSSTVPLVIWLNGGPGASSQLGNLYENGPYQVIRDSSTGKLILQEREYHWVQLFNVLYIDQPIGTGYSYGPETAHINTLEQGAQDFALFLNTFFGINTFSNFKNNQFYITGESYGGKYIPFYSDWYMNHYTVQIRIIVII